MRARALHIFAVLMIVLGAGAFAQDRAVPETRAEITASFAPVVKKTSPAVVNIYTKRVVRQKLNPFMNDPFFGQMFGDMGMRGLSREQVESSLGSGVIVEGDGLIVTNAHVVKGAQEIMVVLNDRREFSARISLLDEHSDIAVLRVDAKGEVLPHAPLKPSESLEVGDIVIAIGNPFGVGQTVTSGIVSALARSSFNINDFNFFIQTDAAINPGNSGGPLVAMDGGVVGINTAIFSQSGGSLGIGFAVPSEMVATVIAAEKSGSAKNGVISRAWLGISGQAVTADIADSLGLNRPAGVLITDVNPASPLAEQGMKVGDVVTKINGRQIMDTAEMKFRLATLPLGEDVAIDVLRQGKAQSFRVKAMAPPDKPARAEEVLKGNHPLNGAKVSNINPAVAVELNLSEGTQGVVVTDMSGGRSMSRVLQAGDIIVSVNDVAVPSVGALKDALDQGMRKRVFAIVIDRGGEKTQIVVR
ncbi:MAG: serine protease [Micavibrio aeruginosavorus]|uniref:Serine protease n=1 Tax=Micavibrio aeruginosavorus TaxID=349221 RepID=A0A2W5BNM0_9BACT|nr:MAG: serine protease [Micavibrio aeruginosavorus]